MCSGIVRLNEIVCVSTWLIVLLCSRSQAQESKFSWPVITREQRPWAYWWWMGSAVDKTNLTRELTRYHDAGYGGVHIIPI